jgi:single-stranded-DNA-specific exonuclease
MKKWELKQHFKENDLSRCLLKNREVRLDDAEKFFNPDYDRDLDDPFKILNMERVSSRVIKAVKNNEKIVIFGDYDTDGICGVAIFHDFFKKINFQNFEIYIPDRFEEGYGLTLKVIEEFMAKEAKLIIVIDCGITNFEEIKKAQEAGIDVVVIDHHLPPSEIPPAYAVVDVYQKRDNYPFKDFSGAGMAFKVVSAILRMDEFTVFNGWERWLLDVVAIAAIADMVSLKDENRVLTYYGFKVLKKTPRLGLKILFEKLKINLQHLSADDVGFLIAPRLNAASRMDHATTSFLLLITNSKVEAEWLAARLEEKNNERKKLVGMILEKIRSASFKRENLIFFGKEDWSPGVLGLAANRILEEYQKPVFLWGKDSKGFVKFSARSNSVDLVELMRLVPNDIFIEFGGHEFAAGAAIKNENLAKFQEELNRAFSKISGSGPKEEVLFIDKKMNLENVNWETFEIIEKFEPFGMDNPKPIFWFSNLKIESVRAFGNGGLHLELTFKKPNNETVKAIGFFMTDQFQTSDGQKRILETGDTVDLAASLDKNCYNGNIELRLRIADLKII